MPQENAPLHWRAVCEAELARVDQVILTLTENDAILIPTLVRHILSAGGKRIRPTLTLLSSRLCGYDGDRHVNLAACIEFLHTATLLHDDVVDESDLRRGNATANQLWGNSASILVGDFLLSRAFQLMAKDGSLEVLRLLSDTSAIITEGEVKQLSAANDITTDENTYIDIISAKTAQLFTAACEIGAVIGERPEDERAQLREFGRNLGIAFQIVDDALDYSAKQEELGKTIGDDFREGKVTLPVILAYQAGNDEEKHFWKHAIEENNTPEDLARATALMQTYGVLDHVMSQAQAYADTARNALNSFSNSDTKQAMLDILDFAVSRPY